MRALLAACTLACAAALQCGRPLPQQQRHAIAPARTGALAMLTADQLDLDSSSAPPGPDPYRLVQDDLSYIKKSIKKMLTSSKGETGAALSSNSVLTMAAREFMDRKGKSFRPMLVLLIGRATDPDMVTDARHTKLAVISEMIHTASLIHADVLEETALEEDPGAGTLVHQEVALDVGNKVRVPPPHAACGLPPTHRARHHS